MLRSKYILPILVLAPQCVVASEDVTQKLRTQVEDATAMRLFQTLEGAKVVAFSKDNVIKGGLEDKDLKGWEDLTRIANELVEKRVGTLDAGYTRSLQSIKQAYAFLKDQVALLHEKYAEYYKKEADKYVARVPKTVLTEEEKESLANVIKQANTFKKNMSSINAAMFNAISRNTPAPESWTAALYDSKGTLKDAADVMPKYKRALEDFNAKQFDDFVKKYALGTKANATTMIDQLEKVAYIMREKIKIKKDAAREANLSDVFKIIAQLQERYPDYMSQLQQHKFGATSDKDSITLFAQSGAYEAVLNQLIREMKNLSQNS